MRFFVAVAMFMVIGCATQLRAEFIPESDISLGKVRSILSNSYGTKIDDDGDIVVTKAGSGRVIVSVIPKTKRIRIAKYYSKVDNRSTSEMILLANKFNWDKVISRVAISPKGESVVDIPIVYKGGISAEALLDMVDWCYVLCDAWENFVLKGGDK